MEHLAPLFQTVLWVALVGGIVWRYHESVDGLLQALKRRIEQGGDLKAGPFELKGGLRSQDRAAQSHKLTNEVRELQLEHQTEDSAVSSQQGGTIQNRYLKAEDLAMRALQAEFAVPIARQVTGGRDGGFDGAFQTTEGDYIVEVKYSYHKFTRAKVRQVFSQLVGSVQKYSWSKVRVLLVLIGESSDAFPVEERELQELVAAFPIPCTIRTYVLGDLERDFGVEVE